MVTRRSRRQNEQKLSTERPTVMTVVMVAAFNNTYNNAYEGYKGNCCLHDSQDLSYHHGADDEEAADTLKECS